MCTRNYSYFACDHRAAHQFNHCDKALEVRNECEKLKGVDGAKLKDLKCSKYKPEIDQVSDQTREKWPSREAVMKRSVHKLLSQK